MTIITITMFFVFIGSAASSIQSGSATSIQAGAILGGICGLINCLIYLALAAWYAYVVYQARSAIKHYVG
jgi:hypothetical protein